MNNLQKILQYVETRNRILTPELRLLQSELELILEKNILEAGVINPGYFSYFVP
jgi:cell division protein FtsB